MDPRLREPVAAGVVCTAMGVPDVSVGTPLGEGASVRWSVICRDLCRQTKSVGELV